MALTALMSYYLHFELNYSSECVAMDETPEINTFEVLFKAYAYHLE